MTCIAAIVTRKGSIMGGDSAVSDSQTKLTMADPKIRDFDGVLVGYAGSIVDGRTAFRGISEHQPSSIVDYLESMTQQKRHHGSQFLVVEAGQIWEIEQGSAIRLADTYAAIGSGASFALGSLYRGHADLDDVRKALSCAEHFSPEVRGPMLILTA